MKNNNTRFGAHLYSSGTSNENLHQLSVTISGVTQFILRAHIVAWISYS